MYSVSLTDPFWDYWIIKEPFSSFGFHKLVLNEDDEMKISCAVTLHYAGHCITKDDWGGELHNLVLYYDMLLDASRRSIQAANPKLCSFYCSPGITMATSNNAAITPTDVQMDTKRIWVLISYLLLVTVLTCWVMYSLWSAQARIEPAKASSPDCSGKSTPVLTGLFPERVGVGDTLSDFLIIGCGFTSATQVKFNGTQHPALLADASHIRVGLSSVDVAAPATIVVTVSNSASDFGSGVFTITPAEVVWRLFPFSPREISLEVQLLLLVLFTGAFGASIYALKSLADYRGDKQLYTSWFTYYLIQPFEGAGIGLLLYLVIRGGFLAGASADAKTINQFGICAIAGLAGAFSDTAFLKLREVFQTLFKPKDDRGGKLKLDITTSKLPSGNIGASYSGTLQTEKGTPPFTWSVTPVLPAGLSLDSRTGTISGTPTAVSALSYEFTVVDSGTPPESASATLALEIKPALAGPTITTTALTDGVVNSPYSVGLQATGGTAPLKWTVTPQLPAGLSLDSNKGTISGTPTAALPKSKFTFAVSDSSSPPESATVDLSLEIK